MCLTLKLDKDDSHELLCPAYKGTIMLRRNFFGFLPALLSAFLWRTPTKSKESLLEKGVSYKCVDEYGNVRWINHLDQLHRENGPAIEHATGNKYWYLNGQLHRVNGPAIECANGDKKWLVNGQLHREDGPAIEYANGDKYWYLKGQRQCEIWLVNGQYGPAVEKANGGPI